MRKSITLFDDQYAFYKELKSEKLLVAFVEYMFEDKDPEWLNSMEQVVWNSLLERMDNWKWRSDAWSKWWAKSHWWGRPRKQAEQLQNNNKTTSKKQAKNNQDKDKDKEEDISNKIEDKDNNKKNKYLDFVCLTEEEHWKLIKQLWERLTNELIEKLNNYIWSTGKRYKSHYFTLLNWSKKEQPHITNYEREQAIQRHRQQIAEQIESFNSKSNKNGEVTNQGWGYNRRDDIGFS